MTQRFFYYLVFIFISCNRIYDNPYDSNTDPNSWNPYNIELVVNDSNSITLLWDLHENRIDGFSIKNNNYPDSNSIIVASDQFSYTDNSNFVIENCGIKFNYSLNSIAGENSSSRTEYSVCGNTFTSTILVSDIGSTNAYFKGNVFSLSPILEKGFCWSTNKNPTLSNNKMDLGNVSGAFASYVNTL